MRMSLWRARQEIYNVRNKWKKEEGRVGERIQRYDTFIDGVIFGLGIALKIVDKYRGK